MAELHHDWKVLTFRNDQLFQCWFIYDRTESEAFKEAAADVANILGGVDDWTLTCLNPTKP